MTNNNNVDELLEAAKRSTDPTVKQALNKLLFVTSLAHDKEYVERSNQYHFHSGCTITVPHADHTTFQMVWNDKEIAIHSMEYQYCQFKYGNMLSDKTPLPGMILIEDKII